MYLPKAWRALPCNLLDDERIRRVGSKAFGLFCALAIHCDDLGTLRADPRQLSLITFGSRRLLREEIPRLIDNGLIMPFLTLYDHRPGDYATEQDPIPAKDFWRFYGSGQFDNGTILVWFWVPKSIIETMSRQRLVQVQYPVCPRSWLIAADLDDYSIDLLQKCRAQSRGRVRRREKEESSSTAPPKTAGSSTTQNTTTTPRPASDFSGEMKVTEIHRQLMSDSEHARLVTGYVAATFTDDEKVQFDQDGQLPNDARFVSQLTEFDQIRNGQRFQRKINGKVQECEGVSSEKFWDMVQRAIEKQDRPLRDNSFLKTLLTEPQFDTKQRSEQSIEQHESGILYYSLETVPQKIGIGKLLNGDDERFDYRILKHNVPAAIYKAICKWRRGKTPLPFADKTIPELIAGEVLVDAH